MHVDLHDCVGCEAFGLGFNILPDAAGGMVGNATYADIFCGEIERLYTYDTLLERAP